MYKIETVSLFARAHDWYKYEEEDKSATDMENYTTSNVSISARCERSEAEETIWLFGGILAAAFAASLGAALRLLTRSARAPPPPLPRLRKEREGKRREQYK